MLTWHLNSTVELIGTVSLVGSGPVAPLNLLPMVTVNDLAALKVSQQTNAQRKNSFGHMIYISRQQNSGKSRGKSCPLRFVVPSETRSALRVNSPEIYTITSSYMATLFVLSIAGATTECNP